MDRPDEPTGRPEPGDGRRRLDRPPSDRYVAATRTGSGTAPSAPSRLRGLAGGVAVAVVGAFLTFVLLAILAETTGLLAVAGATGFVGGLGVRMGARTTLGARSRVGLAIGLALLAVAVGDLGTWAFARTEGGALGPVDYLGAVLGPLVAIQAALAAIGAWIAAL